jgi:hypothetical protein
MKSELEEAAERLYPTPTPYVLGMDIGNSMKRDSFIKGAKWQAERMYSERELEIAYCTGLLNRHLTIDELAIEIKDAQFQIDRLKESNTKR